MLLMAENFEDDRQCGFGFEYGNNSSSFNWDMSILDGKGLFESKCLYLGLNGFNDYTTHYHALHLPIPPTKYVVWGGWLKIPEGTNQEIGFAFLSHDIRQFAVQFSKIAENNYTLDLHVPGDYYRPSSDPDYPPIESISNVPICLEKRYHFLEVFYDSRDAHLGKGKVKIAVDGVLYGVREDVVNSNFKAWGSDPTANDSNISHLAFYMTESNGDAEVRYYLDSFYLLNEEMNYHDDFLGPIQISNLIPLADGDQTNWLAHQDGEECPQAANFESLQNTIFDPDGSYGNYTEGSSHGERDLFCYAPNFDTRFSDLHGVIHAIAYKNTYTTNDLDLLKAIVPISKASGNDIVQEKPHIAQANEFTYNLLQVPYSIFPSLATPWTWELLENGQFGYEFRTKLWTYIIDEQIGISEDLTIEVNP